MERMPMKPCAWCDRDFQPPQRHHRQQCCSRQCGAQYRQAKQCCETGYKPRPSNWRNYQPTISTTDKGLGGTHQRLKAQLLPRAIGTLCPFYHTDPLCPGLMLQGHHLALDHRVARALGGTTTQENVRITHHDCNQRAGSRLGGEIRNATIKRNKQTKQNGWAL